MTDDPRQLDQFLAALRAAWAAENRPLNAHLDVTYRCDLNCTHCYLDNRTTWPEMTTAEWLGVLDQLKEAGVMFLVWSGGDVLMRSDFGTLLERAAALGFLSRIKTHAGQVTTAWAARFKAQNVTRLDVSIYSLRPDVHDTLTRTPGSLTRSLAGINAALAAGIAVKVSCYVQPNMIDEIGALCRFFEDKGCTITFAQRTALDLSATPELVQLQLTEAEMVRASVEILRAQPTAKPRGFAGATNHDPCTAGRALVYISPDGELWPCIKFPMALGNLREKPLLEIWRESEARKALVAWDNRDRTTCQSCSGSGFCTYCPGDAFKMTGDFRKAPPVFHAEARAAMRAWEIVHEDPFSDDAWASVPDESGRAPATKRFVFPIHRAKRSEGKRVTGGK